MRLRGGIHSEGSRASKYRLSKALTVAVVCLSACEQPRADVIPVYTSAQSVESTDCVRVPGSPYSAEIVVGDSPPPCELFFVEDVTLNSVHSAAIVSPTGMMVVLPDGRYVSTTVEGPLALWGKDGAFIRSIGGTGKGPGEWVGIPRLFLGPSANLYIRESGANWLMFDSTGVFTRVLRGGGNEGARGVTHILDDGRLLKSDRSGSDGGARIVIRDLRDPDSVHLAIQIPTPRIVGTDAVYVSPQLAYGGGTWFWVGPPDGSDEYLIRGYDTNGGSGMSIRRNAPWFTHRRVGRSEPPGSVVAGLQADSTNLLVLIRIASQHWRPLANGAALDSVKSSFYDFVLESFDRTSGSLLSSQRIDGDDFLRRLPSRFVAGTNVAYLPEQDSIGIPRIRVFRYFLRSRLQQ